MLDRQFIADPASIGIDPDRLEALYAYVRQEVAESLPSAQVAIGRHGKVAGVRTFGEVTRGGVTGPAADDTLYCIFSSTKAVAAAALWLLMQEGKLRIDEKVSSIIPEFSGMEKDNITVEQVMLHVGGFPSAPMHPRLWEDRAGRLERMKGWRLNWEPGSRFEYHATSAHWVLVEVIERKSGMDFRDFIRRRITEPMGVPDLFVGLPDSEHHRAADIVYLIEGGSGGGGEQTAEAYLHFNLPSQRRSGCPGAGGFAGAGEIALFYQRLVCPTESGAWAPLSPETIAMATTVRTDGRHVDEAGVPVNRALSVVVAGDQPEARGFGPLASPRAFGHGGAGGQLAWGDPETGLSVGFVTNAFVDPERQRVRGRTIAKLAVECLR